MRLKITCEDRLGIAQQVLGVFVEHNINIKGIDTASVAGPIFVHIPDLDFSEDRKSVV